MSLKGSHASAPLMVGRDQEVATILRCVKESRTGLGANVLVCGDGGIGKTRLLDVVSGRLALMGVTVVRGRATQHGRAVPYALVRDVMRSIVACTGPEMQASARALDRQLVTDDSVTDQSVSTPAPSEIFASTVELLTGLAGDRVLVVITEDVHLADPDSLSLLARVFRRLPDSSCVSIASATTPIANAVSPALSGLLNQFTDHERGVVLDLAPLDRAETRALVAGALGADPSSELVDLVHDSAGGNPLFTLESMYSIPWSAADEGRGSTGVGSRTAGASLIDRFFPQAGPALDVGLVLSVLTHIPLRHLPLVAASTALDDATVSRCFDQLVAKQVLVLRDDGFEFAHSMLRDALYESIGPAERRRLHRIVVDRLEHERRDGIEVPINQLAAHIVQCAEPGDRRAVEVLSAAGRASPDTAPHAAAAWFEAAAALLPHGSAERANLLAQQATAMFRASKPVDVARLGLIALQTLTPGPDRRRTLSDTANSLYISGDVLGAIDVIDEEEHAWDGISVALEAQRANYLAQAGLSTSAPVDHAESAVGVKQAEIVVMMMHDLQRAGLSADAPTASRLMKALELHAVSSSHQVRVAITSLVAIEHLFFSDITAAARLLEAAERDRGASRHPSIAGQLESAAVVLAYEEGRWDDALGLIPEVLWELEQTQARLNRGWVRNAECRILLERGHLRAAAALSQGLEWHIESNRAAIECTRAMIAAASGDRSTALEILQTSHSRMVLTGWRYGLDEVLYGLVELSLATGDARASHSYVEELEDEAARTSWPAGRVRALLARAQVDESREAVEHALATASDAGLRLHLAKAQLIAGRLGLEPADNLTAAYRFLYGIGSMTMRKQVGFELRARSLPVPRPSVGRGRTLTDTEMDLARLVSDGLTNPEIAALMHYSVKTVEAYLTRLYAKTGCRSRIELARAIDRGVLSVTGPSSTSPST